MSKIFYYSALLFAFILPLSRAGISFFLLWFFLLFLFQRDYRRIGSFIKENRPFHAMGAFLLFLGISFLWSENHTEALNQIRLYSYWIIIPILAMNLKKEWLPSIITAFLIGMFVSEVIAYGIYFEWWEFKDRTPEYPSPFMFHIHYSIFLAVTSVILLSRLLSKRYTWHSKLPMFMFFLTSTGNLMISTGRTGQLALLIAIGVAIIIHYRFTLKSFVMFFAVSSLLFVGAYINIELFQKRADLALSDIQQLREGNYDTSWGLRAAYWIITKEIVQEHPLLGVGIGDYKHGAVDVLSTKQHNFSPETVEWCSSTHFHNQYLMILAQSGFVGFVLMIWVLIELFRLKIDDPELKEFSVLGLTVFVVACIAEPLWTMQFPIILFIFILAISIASSTRKESAKEE